MKCVITLLDEVNCTVKGMEPPTVRKCVNALKFEVPNARHLPSVKLGRWDGKVSFFSVGGGTQIGMLDRVLPIIEAENYEIEVVDLRPKFDFNLPLIDKDAVSDCTWPTNHPTHPNKPIQLRDHQVELINNFLQNPHGIQVAPTSAGKTLTIAALCRQVENLGRTIIVVPNKQLIGQTLEDFKMLGLDAGVYYGDQKDWHKQHTICTWQSLDRLNKDSKPTKKDPKESDENIAAFSKDVVAIICDECHQADAAALKTILTKVFSKVPLRWGVTGTMVKEEYKALSITSSLGPVINTLKAADLQEAGVLSNCEIHIIQVQDDHKFGSYHDEHNYLVNDPDRIEMLSKFIDNVSLTGNTLVLVQNIPTGKKMAELLPNSVFISGSVKVSDRNDEYAEIATNDNLVIIATYGVASTGINVPRIFNLVLLEPGKSFIRTIQSIGRSLRRASDKDFATIYDVCASTKYSKRHLTERKKYYKEQAYPFQVIKAQPEDLC